MTLLLPEPVDCSRFLSRSLPSKRFSRGEGENEDEWTCSVAKQRIL